MTSMDSLTILHIIFTVVSFLCFLAWIAWFLNKNDKAKYDQYAKDLLEDNDTTPNPSDAVVK